MGTNRAENHLVICLTSLGLIILCGCSVYHKPIEISVVSGRWSTDFLRDYSYCEGRIFDLAYPCEIGPYDSVSSIQVYQQELSVRDNPTAEHMYLKAGVDTNSLVDEREVPMAQIESDEYELLYGQDTSHCPIALVFYSSRYRAIGVHMIIRRCLSSGAYAGVTDTIGFMSNTVMDTLRIILPLDKDNYPGHPAWQLMWRNCYSIPKNISFDDFEVKIFKGLVGHERSNGSQDYQVRDHAVRDYYLRILGLDQYNENGGKVPDGKFDERVELFRPDWGLLIFPEREPFNSNRTFVDANGNLSDALLTKVSTLYYYFTPPQKIKGSTYYLRLRHTTPGL
jgi:hypothetical protein